MGFWRDELIEPALDADTRRQIAEQMDWIARDAANPRPYFQLALLYRMQGKADEALGLLLEAVRLNDGFAEAQAALAEIYAVRQDYASAWRHARLAERHGRRSAVELLVRHQVPEG